MPEPVLSIFGKEEGINKPGKPCNEPGALRNAGPDAPLGQGMGRARQGAKVVRRGTDARTDGRTGSGEQEARAAPLQQHVIWKRNIIAADDAWGMLMPREREKRGVR